MSFPRYPKYKDSGVEWLGEVPGEWEVLRIGYLEKSGSDFVTGPFGSMLGSNDYVSDGIPVIRGLNTTLSAESRFVENDFVYVSRAKFEELSRCDAKPGDVIVTARGTVGKVGIVPPTVPEALISPNQLRYRPDKSRVIADYFFYLFSSEPLQKEVGLIADSVAQPNLNLGSLKSIKCPLPHVEEQQTIAAFLDRETAKIDALVAEQENLIALLKEKRQAVISHAVTKGLDPTVPMKDSGIEWLGEVPERWAVHSLRHTLDAVFNGLTANQISQTEETVPVTRIETISKGVIDMDKVGYILRQDARADRVLVEGDILFSNINSLNVIGNCAQYYGGETIYAGMNLLVLRPTNNINAQWLFWLIKSPSFRQMVECFAKPAINQASISQSSLLSIAVATPSLPEQCAIVNFLDSETAKLDTLTAEAQRGINLLKERRAALISAAVTGKMDVRQAE
jgi:type I restriction enzyme S subunit